MAKRAKAIRKTSAPRLGKETDGVAPSTSRLSLSSWKTVLPALLIVATGLWIYWPALHGSWLWDDTVLIRDNPRLRDLQGLYEIWFVVPETDYWPLTWTLLWVEWHLWGDQTIGYHLVSVGFHLLSAFLIWRLFSKLGLRWGWLGGLLFVVHPLTVESVAWMSEIKNTLSLPLFLLSLQALIESDETNNPRTYGSACLLYLAAMLAKTSVISLPLVFLLYCWWKRDRIVWSDIRKTIPFLALALVLGLITLSLQNSHTAETASDLAVNSRGPLLRLLGAGIVIFFYLGKFLWPAFLLPIYPRWEIAPFSPLQVATFPLLAFLFYGCWTQRHRWGRVALLGLGFFVITVSPVLGLLKMSYLSISWVADHLAYLPMVGLIGLVVAAIEAADQKLSPAAGRMGPVRLIVVLPLVAILILLAAQSRACATHYRDNEKLFGYAIHVDPTNWVAYNELGLSLASDPDRIPEAITQFTRALQLHPNSAEVHYDLGSALVQANRVPEAIDQFGESIRLDPNFTQAYDDWGAALAQQGKLSEAVTYYQNAIRTDPTFGQAHNDLANAFLALGRYSDAVPEYEKAIQINPDVAVIHSNYGLVLAKLDRRLEAVEQFKVALRLDPDDQIARQGLDSLR